MSLERDVGQAEQGQPGSPAGASSSSAAWGEEAVPLRSAAERKLEAERRERLEQIGSLAAPRIRFSPKLLAVTGLGGLAVVLIALAAGALGGSGGAPVSASGGRRPLASRSPSPPSEQRRTLPGTPERTRPRHSPRPGRTPPHHSAPHVGAAPPPPAAEVIAAPAPPPAPEAAPSPQAPPPSSSPSPPPSPESTLNREFGFER